jgi:hypothetical protein
MSSGLAFLLGVAAAPLLPKIAKPVLRQVVKTGADVAVQAKGIAAEVGEDLQDIVAETSVKDGSAKFPSQ